MVTVLRASDPASARTRAAPHSAQNLLVSGLAWPHAWHVITCAAYGSGRARRERTSLSRGSTRLRFSHDLADMLVNDLTRQLPQLKRKPAPIHGVETGGSFRH